MGTSVKMVDEIYGHLVRDSHDCVRQALGEARDGISLGSRLG
jgi:hypothetical protein